MSPRMLVAPKGGREVASSRYRIHDLAPLLGERGWTVASLTPSMRRDGRALNAARDVLLANLLTRVDFEQRRSSGVESSRHHPLIVSVPVCLSVAGVVYHWPNACHLDGRRPFASQHQPTPLRPPVRSFARSIALSQSVAAAQ